MGTVELVLKTATALASKNIPERPADQIAQQSPNQNPSLFSRGMQAFGKCPKTSRRYAESDHEVRLPPKDAVDEILREIHGR